MESADPSPQTQNPLRVLIAPDKFKGTLTAAQAAEAIARGWSHARPKDALEILPISDGGDGFGQILGQLLHAETLQAEVVDAAHRPVTASWWWSKSAQTAVIESAQVIGLARLPPGAYHPFELDTYGLGLLLQQIARHGARRCLAGIGGSATNDAGFGMARALGWQFHSGHGAPITRWTQLDTLAQVRPPPDRSLFQEVIVAVDVQNPLLGPVGATRVYGPQKGLRSSDFGQAEACLERLATVLQSDSELADKNAPGAGAAGGLGFGFAAFTGAELRSGFDLFAAYVGLPQKVRTAQLVITAEGALDQSTLMGKGVGQLAQLCRHHRIPCLALAGQIPGDTNGSPLFFQTHALAPGLTSLEEAQANAAHWLRHLAERVASAL